MSMLAPAGASLDLVRALRGLYDDSDSINRRSWLLQPVLHSAAPTTPRKCGATRPPSAGRLGGPPPRPTSAGPQRPRRPASARAGGSSAPRRHIVMPDEKRKEPASIGGFPVSPVLGRADDERPRRPRSGRPWSARPPSAGHRDGLTAAEAATRALAMLSAESEALQEARDQKSAKIRSWLERKDAELNERRRIEEDEERQLNEEYEQRQQKRLARKAEEQRQNHARLQAAARRRHEVTQEVHRACAEGTPTGFKAGMLGALAAYSKNSRPASASARGRRS